MFLKGFFVGLILDGIIFVERKDVNRNFYGSSIFLIDIFV